jgi:hypothetical protein
MNCYRQGWQRETGGLYSQKRVALMGIKKSGLAVIASRLKNASILSLGYPDLVMTGEDVTYYLGIDPTRFSDTGGWHGKNHPLPETMDVISKIGSTMHCVDIVASRGVEQIADMNYPTELGKYDLVLDCGTLEHVPNFWQGLLNATNAVKPGGCIFHTAPMSLGNHGFYNINPTFWHDVYTQNGWQIELLCQERNNDLYTIHGTKRFSMEPEISLYVVATKRSEGELKFPVQTKYLNNPGLK